MAPKNIMFLYGNFVAENKLTPKKYASKFLPLPHDLRGLSGGGNFAPVVDGR